MHKIRLMIYHMIDLELVKLFNILLKWISESAFARKNNQIQIVFKYQFECYEKQLNASPFACLVHLHHLFHVEINYLKYFMICPFSMYHVACAIAFSRPFYVNGRLFTTNK